MTVVDLVEKLKAGQHRADAIARLVGWAVIIRAAGWDAVPMHRISRSRLERDFRLLDIDPLKLEI